MANTTLTPELAKLVGELAGVFAQSQPVVAAKARINLFYQNPQATDLFRSVQQYGETLRNKHMEGMPPTEEEISKFDSMRQAVVDNPLCSGFLESRQLIDDMLVTVNQYLCMAVEKGTAPTDEEVAEALERAASQSVSCSCGGNCHGGDGECSCGGDCHCGEGGVWHGGDDCKCREEDGECHCNEPGHECHCKNK